MGVNLNEDKWYHVSLLNSFAAVGANTTAEQTVSLPGVKVGDSVLSVNKKTAQAGLGIVGKRVSAADTIAVTFINSTGGSITPTAGDAYSVTIFRPEKTYTSIPS